MGGGYENFRNFISLFFVPWKEHWSGVWVRQNVSFQGEWMSIGSQEWHNFFSFLISNPSLSKLDKWNKDGQFLSSSWIVTKLSKSLIKIFSNYRQEHVGCGDVKGVGWGEIAFQRSVQILICQIFDFQPFSSFDLMKIRNYVLRQHWWDEINFHKF